MSARCSYQSTKGTASGSRFAVSFKAATVCRRPAFAAAPAGAYWFFRRSCALADHGINSQSRHSQSVLSSSQRPALSAAQRMRSRNSRSRLGCALFVSGRQDDLGVGQKARVLGGYKSQTLRGPERITSRDQSDIGNAPQRDLFKRRARAASSLVSHSQITTCFQPASLSAVATSASRSSFRVNFLLQNSRLVFGV